MKNARATYRIVYPFVQEPLTLMDEEGSYTIMAWHPGVVEPPREKRQYLLESPHYYAWCHAEGTCVLHEIERVVLPKPYKPRVFYVRTWVDPEGKAFGKTTLRVATEAKFLNMVAGYGRPYLCMCDGQEHGATQFN